MNSILAQLKQWPPTASTVHGVAVLLALLGYTFTGSWELAGAVAGLVAVICPQDAAAINKGLQDAREIATAPKP